MSEGGEQVGPFEVTEAAKRQLEAAAQSHGLWRFGVRVRLVGKDASRGYDLSFDELPDRGEVVWRSAGLKLFANEAVAAAVVDPVVIDWSGRGFVFRARRAGGGR